MTYNEDSIQDVAHCEICLDDDDERELYSFCCRILCSGCIVGLYELGIQGGTAFPVRCCCCELHIAVTNVIREMLGEMMADVYEDIYRKRTDLNGLHCSKASCSAYLGEAVIGYNSTVTCPACQAITCVRCEAEAHSCRCIEQDIALDQKYHPPAWKLCPECDSIAEESVGTTFLS